LTSAAEYLDLTRHDFEDIVEKMINLNGRDYIISEVIGEGGQGTVYALMNTKSGLNNLVGKIYHYLKGTPEYEETLARLSDIMFALGAAGKSPEPTHIVPEFLCETSGGLIGVMENLSASKTDMTDLVNESARLLNLGDVSKAASVCDQILKHNANHVLALANKSTALASAGDLYGAINLLSKAVEIEPNDSRLTRALARYYDHAHRVETALATLKKSLGRWRWDGWTWKLLVQMAVEWDLTDLIADELEYGFVALPSRLEEVRSEVAKSVERRKRYEAQLESGLGVLRTGDWGRALTLLISAQSVSRNNALALLGAHVCRFHLGLWADISAQTAEVFQSNFGARRLAAAVISMVGLAQSGDIERAKALALFLAENVELPVDLPRIPLAVWSDYIVESLPLDPILSVIRMIAESPDIAENDARTMQQLLARYDELKRMM
jgi:tetratricopeptide (TPR) repeat protein